MHQSAMELSYILVISLKNAHFYQFFNATFFILLTLVHFIKNVWYCAYTCDLHIVIISLQTQIFWPICTFVSKYIKNQIYSYYRMIDLIVVFKFEGDEEISTNKILY